MEVSASQLGPDSTPKPGLPVIGPVADHQLIRMIGQGSYGQVWLARNVMGVYRAIKIVHRNRFEQSRPFEREYHGIQQFEPISRSHEGFIDIMHIGRNEEEGYFYYIMELGDDCQKGHQIDPETYAPNSLAGENRPNGRLPLDECLRIALVLSDALYHLHGKGLIHRDIKPSNILLVDGVPKLADIGLVAPLGNAPSYVGTEGYIPPEGPGTVKADIYSLGKVLYEISTGKDRQEFPELPSDFAEFDPGFVEFNEIILKACQNDHTRRYGSAREMHNEIAILKNGHSIRRLRFLEKRLAQIKRAGVISSLLAAVVMVIGYPIYQDSKQASERRNHQIGYKVAQGAQALKQGDMQGALRPFVEALAMNLDPQNSRTHRVRCNSVFEQCPKFTHFWLANDKVWSVSFSPDGRYLLAACGTNGVKAFDTKNGEALPVSFGDLELTYMASFHPKGDQIAIASLRGLTTVWSFPEGRRLLDIQQATNVYSARFDPLGNRLVTGGSSRKAHLWSARDGAAIGETESHGDIVVYAAFSPKGDYLVTCSLDNTVQLWKADTLQRHRDPLRHSSWAFYASFSPDGKRIITACFDRKTRMWDVESGKLMLETLAHEDGFRVAEYSPDGNFVLTAGYDGTGRLWDAGTLQAVKRNAILRHSHRVVSACMDGDGHRIATGCTDGSIRLWDLATGQEHLAPVPATYNASGDHFIVKSSNRLHVLNAVNEQPVAAPLLFPSRVIHAQLNWNGSLLLAGWKDESNQTTWQVFEVVSGKPLTQKVSTELEARHRCLSGNGQWLILASEREAQVWNLQNAREMSRIQTEDLIGHVAFSPDARQWMLIRGNIAEIRSTGLDKVLFPPIAMPKMISHGEFSPDNRTLALGFANSALEPCYAQVFDSNDGKPVSKPLYHRDGVLHVAYSPDGKRLVTSGEDFSAIIWDRATSQPVTPPLKHLNQVLQSSFSPDGRWLASFGTDGTCRIWDVETGEPITPPVNFIKYMGRGRFVANGRKVLGLAEPVKGSIWSLPDDVKPVQDWIKFAEIISGSPLRDGNHPQGMIKEMVRAWKDLKAQYPADLEVSQEELESWHERQFDTCQRDGKWAAARFHLERLIELRPFDETLAAQLPAVQASAQEKE